MNPTELVQTLTKWRTDAKLSQEQLAEKAGVPLKEVQALEAGQDFELATLFKIARFFGKHVEIGLEVIKNDAICQK